MLIEELLFGSSSFRLQDTIMETGVIILTISSIQADAACPKCQHRSQRVHSHYWRTAADVPLTGSRVRLRLLVRRFFCDNAACKRKTFAERFLGFLDSYARRTRRLAFQQRQVGLVVGGQAGAKLLDSLSMPVSADTVLRLVKKVPTPGVSSPRVLGVDDWAWSKGQRYGTILVDLEQRRVVDLLPDRSAETLAAWLRAHPGVKVVSRDRALEYIKGIEQGAPHAVQVADRWHLLRNLGDALIRLLEQNRAYLYAAAAGPAVEVKPEPLAVSMQSEPIDNPPALTKAEQRQKATRERRLARYQAIMDLNEQGVKARAIARQLGISRGTVQRHLRTGGFPEMSEHAAQPSILDPHLPYLQQRWAEGCHNGMQLYREIRQKGYQGSRPLVSRWVAGMRKKNPPQQPPNKAIPGRSEAAVRPWSARYAVGLLLKEPGRLEPEKKASLERMLKDSPVMPAAYNFAQAFIRMVQNQHARALKPWLNAVIENKIPELAAFAKSLKKDLNAVFAALSLPWSNGQVEGQVNRLKMIKRQMYGRAGFDLLRIRVIAQ